MPCALLLHGDTGENGYDYSICSAALTGRGDHQVCVRIPSFAIVPVSRVQKRAARLPLPRYALAPSDHVLFHQVLHFRLGDDRQVKH
jgi:hypothetical protein